MKAEAYTTKFCSRIIWRPICLLVILGLSGLIFWRIWVITKQSDRMVGSERDELCRKSISNIKATSKLLYPLNHSAIALAKILSSSRNQTQLLNLAYEKKVPPELLLTLSMNPHLSQISYLGTDGQLFSIFSDNDKIVALFLNSSCAKWHMQPVNQETGKLYGKSKLISSISSSIETVNTSWFQQALNNPNGYSWVGKSWINDKESLFLTAAPINNKGVIFLGIPAKVIVDQFSAMDFYGGDLQLATEDGHVVIETKIPNARILVENQNVTVQVVKPNGGFVGTIGSFSCQSDDGESNPFNAKLGPNKYMFFCSTMDIFGVHTVYVLAYGGKGVPSLVHKNSKLSLALLIVLFVFIAISICVFLFFIIRAARREVFLCAAVVKQKDATEQAERKSMNKTTAFNRANHDVRASLGAISALAKLCQDNVMTDTLASNLRMIQATIDDLFGILNSVLDFSKIEAGKMELQEEEFNLAQLLEEVVDMFYHAAISKGVDLILDPSDDSVIECCIVKGDKVKLKQILWNLLSNAVKFTYEGHITVRAMIKKPSFENAIIASNTSVLVKFLSRVCVRNKEDYNSLNVLHAAHQDPHLRDFVIEVDDTGKGIPRDLQKSIFENFFQVKGPSPGQEGTGLGLGIVQSLVRLMGGDIRIVDKEAGEKGTCFNFNVKLTLSESAMTATEEEHPLSTFQHFALRRGHSPKTNGSHVVLLMANDERRRVLTKYIESLNIKVSNVQGNDLMSVLERIKGRLNISYFSHSGKSLEGPFDSLSLSQSTSVNSQLGIDIEGNGGPREGTDHISLPFRKNSSKNSPGVLVIVIDASADIPGELDSFLGSFKKDIHGARCKIVWLDDQPTETFLARPFDYVVWKPFHGSRLYQVLGLIPELKKCILPKLTMELRSVQEIEHPQFPSNLIEMENQDRIAESTSSQEIPELEQTQMTDEEIKELPLSGKKILVVDDTPLLRRITEKTLVSLGAKVEECENGKQAFDKIRQILSDHKKGGQLSAPIYDYVFMDCRMPQMDGYTATRLIRAEEERYNVRIPIIALTSDAMPEELAKTIEAGMDRHMTRPLEEDSLLQMIDCLQTESSAT